MNVEGRRMALSQRSADLAPPLMPCRHIHRAKYRPGHDEGGGSAPIISHSD
jgi:hypothetical protein